MSTHLEEFNPSVALAVRSALDLLGTMTLDDLTARMAPPGVVGERGSRHLERTVMRLAELGVLTEVDGSYGLCEAAAPSEAAFRWTILQLLDEDSMREAGFTDPSHVSAYLTWLLGQRPGSILTRSSIEPVQGLETYSEQAKWDALGRWVLALGLGEPSGPDRTPSPTRLTPSPVRAIAYGIEAGALLQDGERGCSGAVFVGRVEAALPWLPTPADGPGSGICTPLLSESIEVLRRAGFVELTTVQDAQDGSAVLNLGGRMLSVSTVERAPE